VKLALHHVTISNTLSMLSRSPSRTPSRSPPKGYTDAQPASSQHTSDMQSGSSHHTSNSADSTQSPERRSPLSRPSQSQAQHPGRIPASPFGPFANSPPGATGSSPAGMSTSSHSAMQVSATSVTYTLQKGNQPNIYPMKEWKQQSNGSFAKQQLRGLCRTDAAGRCNCECEGAAQFPGCCKAWQDAVTAEAHQPYGGQGQ